MKISHICTAVERCEDLLISSLHRSANMWNFHISKIFIHLDVYLYPIHWPAPSWLVSSIGRALHRYRRGHGFKSRTGLNFFQVLFITTRFSSVLSCEDLLISCRKVFSNWEQSLKQLTSPRIAKFHPKTKQLILTTTFALFKALF